MKLLVVIVFSILSASISSVFYSEYSVIIGK